MSIIECDRVVESEKRFKEALQDILDKQRIEKQYQKCEKCGEIVRTV